MTAEAHPAPTSGGFRLIPALGVALGVAILLALGVWQVERLQWKTQLLARIAALQTAPPEPLGVVLNRITSRGSGQRLGAHGEVDFVRVQAACPSLEQTPTLRLYAVLGGVMGRRLITACPIEAGPYRSILVDRGFAADGGAPGREAAAPAAPLTSPIVGVLRVPERANWMTLPNKPGANDWRFRDIPAMAAALKAPAPAPVFLMLESPAPPGGQPPRPAAIPTDIPNNHLGYALTWFGLAAGLVGVYVASLRRGRAAR